jgi:NAD(P)-dependent dehydrogenase (short-subunit alcohol dehydrogenase family)
VAIAFAREGADLLISYLNEEDDAQEVKALVEKEGRKVVLVAGDIREPDHCRSLVERASMNLGEWTSWSTMPLIRPRSRKLARSAMRNGG